MLKIFANDIDLSTNTPDFCVGQTIGFWASWLYSLPHGVKDSIQHWHLREICERGIQLFRHLLHLRKNTDWLTNMAVIPCWYVNGQGGACSIGFTLHMFNGQYANMRQRKVLPL